MTEGDGRMQPSRVWMFVLVLMVPMALSGCQRVNAPRTTVPAEGKAATAETSATAAWRAQALGLGRAIGDILGSLASLPEPRATSVPEGTFGALVLDVDESDRTITIDPVEMLTGEDAHKAAQRTHAEGSGDVWVNNHEAQKIRVPVAPDASFVVWYPGEAALNVSPPDTAALSAMSFEQFARAYRADVALHDGLATGGVWLTVSEGSVSSAIEPLSP